VTFHGNSGAPVPAPTAVYHGDRVSIQSNSWQSGHRFVGWFETPHPTLSNTAPPPADRFNFAAPIAGDTDIHAVWGEHFTVTLVNGGTGESVISTYAPGNDRIEIYTGNREINGEYLLFDGFDVSPPAFAGQLPNLVLTDQTELIVTIPVPTAGNITFTAHWAGVVEIVNHEMPDDEEDGSKEPGDGLTDGLNGFISRLLGRNSSLNPQGQVPAGRARVGQTHDLIAGSLQGYRFVAWESADVTTIGDLTVNMTTFSMPVEPRILINAYWNVASEPSPPSGGSGGNNGGSSGGGGSGSGGSGDNGGRPGIQVPPLIPPATVTPEPEPPVVPPALPSPPAGTAEAVPVAPDALQNTPELAAIAPPPVLAAPEWTDNLGLESGWDLDGDGYIRGVADTRIFPLFMGVSLFGLNGQPSWALVNLILSVFGFVLMVTIICDKVRKSLERKKHPHLRLLSMPAPERNTHTNFDRLTWRAIAIAMGIAGISLFLLTQSICSPMVMADIWTVAHLVIAAVQVIVILRHKKDVGNGEKNVQTHTDKEVYF